MRNFLTCSSLIRLAIMIVVVALIGSQKIANSDARWEKKSGDYNNTSGGRHHSIDGNSNDDDSDDECCDEILAKLDQLLEGDGETPTCCDAWDKQLGEDRFVLVLPTDANPDGAAVRDNETCLVWEQSPSTAQQPTWFDAHTHCFRSEVGGRGGWRMPTIEELASLKDTVNTNPALPDGHPFDTDAVQLDFYWSSTTVAEAPHAARVMAFDIGLIFQFTKTNEEKLVWCVRGGP